MSLKPIARKEGGRVTLWSRHGTNFTDRLPKVAEAVCERHTPRANPEYTGASKAGVTSKRIVAEMAKVGLVLAIPCQARGVGL
jgi:hypothetical protein